MFLKKLDISKKEVIILAIGTIIFIAALAVFLVFSDIGLKDEATDLNFLGYQFTVGPTEVEISTPLDEPFMKEINDDSIHELEILSERINDAYISWKALIRNAMILIYLVFFILIIMKKKETYFQGLFKGFLIGAALLLLLGTIIEYVNLRSLLVSYEHHISHMIFPG